MSKCIILLWLFLFLCHLHRHIHNTVCCYISAVRCTEPPITGPCRASFTKWFYDPYDQACTRFNYGGCGGNENQFESEDECMKVCQGVTGESLINRLNGFEIFDDPARTMHWNPVVKYISHHWPPNVALYGPPQMYYFEFFCKMCLDLDWRRVISHY